ncbi:helix-turn-helix domain-containing protein [Chryseobacterium gwangjuense]|uniref:helix-turn-helix domain-containing protein n=1 Tax=Chryseobacterium gwangjuense TaxID=1069980 RepID=UPI001E56C056|nr:AraC family transcriptional regulator [Chryseobacterium gwangjuense]MCE3075563.1 AraC family transcriptional regulator [Chryseobacterium gwangjuense]
MKMYVKFDFNALCRKVLDDQLKEYGLKYRMLDFGEVEFYEDFTQEQHLVFKRKLQDYGIEIIESQKIALVQKIKDAIVGLVFAENNISIKASIYIAEKLNHSYGYLSNLFSEITYTSIENFIIIQKIEYAKELMLSNKYSLTEISLKLNYSSVAHLSSQFKNITGLTPSQFLKIIGKRKNLKEVELSTKTIV